MRAARVVAPGEVRVEDVPDVGEAGPGTVVVRTRWASICGSDLHKIFGALREQPFPWAPGQPGHEAVGEVVHGGSSSLAPGDLVLATPSPPVAAAFAEYQMLEERYVVPLPLGAGPKPMLLAQQLGTVIFALKRIWPGEPAEVAAVVGAGPAGLCFTRLLKRRGFGTVVTSDLSPDRLRAAGRHGADVVVRADEQSLVDVVMDLTGGRGADLVVEAAGHDATRAQAMTAVRVGGRIGLYGLPERSGDATFPYHVLFRRQPTIEVVYGAQEEAGLGSFREAVHLIQQGELDDLVSHTFNLDLIADALAVARDRSDGALKVCISM